MFRHTLLIAICMGALSLSSCKNEVKTDTTTDKNLPPKPDTLRVEPAPSLDNATTYQVAEGIVYWSAKKAIRGQHNGTVKVKGGELKVVSGRLLAGTVTLDMTSIENVDLKDNAERQDLVNHLKSGDFFNVAQFPTATFKFDEILPSNLPAFNSVAVGELTIKDKSNSVNIPFNLKVEGNTLTASSTTFIINRTKWGVNFHSGVLGTAKDKLIEDNIMLQLNLTAKSN
jgi:polyisoprenoid-binding protein YceI